MPEAFVYTHMALYSPKQCLPSLHCYFQQFSIPLLESFHATGKGSATREPQKPFPTTSPHQSHSMPHVATYHSVDAAHFSLRHVSTHALYTATTNVQYRRNLLVFSVHLSHLLSNAPNTMQYFASVLCQYLFPWELICPLTLMTTITFCTYCAFCDKKFLIYI